MSAVCVFRILIVTSEVIGRAAGAIIAAVREDERRAVIRSDIKRVDLVGPR